ncbi:large ribosomal subunit protein P1-like [Nicotiana tabacum]|uniref:60S acidic ribosomal protein P1-like n=1 Tax=Nicotiana tabacum TaxID=4097 RepID=A0A1S3XAP7_TOBAC|nr:60S acidic ribosomal protein P1-like [Nicotiana tomentosiformis]XP_016436977.1 PREDICTED: 60S acidic ribosomal protein P1-like [Nicotiana tabacum]
MSSTGELTCTYACLILHDDGIPINAEKIGTLIKAANLKVESYWPSLFAKLCQKMNVDELVMNVGVGVGGTAASTASAPAHDAAAAPSANDKKKEEVKEESDDELMFSLFD